MDNEPLSDITKDTETICRNIFLAAKDGKISSKDVVVYMSMRTVRRLLQNSAECVENINRLEMKNKAQGNAYLWMIIQPFISIDQFSCHNDQAGTKEVQLCHLSTSQIKKVC